MPSQQEKSEAMLGPGHRGVEETGLPLGFGAIYTRDMFRDVLLHPFNRRKTAFYKNEGLAATTDHSQDSSPGLLALKPPTPPASSCLTHLPRLDLAQRQHHFPEPEILLSSDTDPDG